METMQNNSCGCQSAAKGSDPTSSERYSSNSDGHNVCQMLSDPKWIKENIVYFPVGFAAENGIFKDISPKETRQMIEAYGQDQHLVVLDVKTEQEYLNHHLSNSRHIDFFSSSFKDDLFRLDKNKIYIVICKVGVRSEIAMKLMKKMGFKEVYNVFGGDDRWFAEEIPYR